MNKIAVLILAAGGSSRMGVPKQLLKWNKTNLLQHTINNAKKCNYNDIIVVLGSNYELITSQISNEGISVLNHKNWKNGLGSSIAYGVKYIQKNIQKIEGVLIILADQPLIDSNYLKSLIENFEPNKKQIIATSYSKGKLGIPVLFDSDYLKELSKLDNDFGAKHLLDKYKSHVITLMTSIQTVDLDSEEDYIREYNLKFKK